MKTHSPLLGFNTNVRHKGKVFHIQTEDSGVKHPHVITHLFADGGRILKSIKTSYAEHLAEDGLTETVRTMMKDQHKTMFMALRDGSFDSVIDEPGTHGSVADVRAVSLPSEAKAASAVPAPAAGAPAPAKAPRPDPPAASAEQSAVAVASAPPSVRSDPEAVASWKGVRVDLEVLERAASAGTDDPALFQPVGDMPPPPAAMLSPKRPTGSYRALTPEPPGVETGSRYVASRPAAIFATARPSEGGNVFGEEMISDKSLDEVILSFLAEEFGTNPGEPPEGGKR